jgi:hypothetical protein
MKGCDIALILFIALTSDGEMACKYRIYRFMR